MKKPLPKTQGLITTIVVIIVALIALGYFGFDVRKIIESPQVQENLEYTWNLVSGIAKEVWAIAGRLTESLISFIKELSGAVSNWKA